MTLLRLEDDRGRKALLTKNLVKGARVYNEDLVIRQGEEYRTWDPFRSKLAAAILKALPPDLISEGDRVLYLGTSTGTTASHVSDLIGERGVLIGVEFAPRVAREFLEKVARKRQNVIPYVADARDPSKYSVTMVDIVYCDIAQADQTEIAITNSLALLKKGGKLLLVVKARSINVLKDPRGIFNQERRKLETAGFSVLMSIELAPFEKDHAMIYAVR